MYSYRYVVHITVADKQSLDTDELNNAQPIIDLTNQVKSLTQSINSTQASIKIIEGRILTAPTIEKMIESSVQSKLIRYPTKENVQSTVQASVADALSGFEAKIVESVNRLALKIDGYTDRQSRHESNLNHNIEQVQAIQQQQRQAEKEALARQMSLENIRKQVTDITEALLDNVDGSVGMVSQVREIKKTSEHLLEATSVNAIDIQEIKQLELNRQQERQQQLDNRKALYKSARVGIARFAIWVIPAIFSGGAIGAIFAEIGRLVLELMQ